MPTETSIRITAKNALVQLLADELAGVQVGWGHPGKRIAKETVYVADIPEHEQRADKLGDVTRGETFEIAVVVNVMRKASQQVVSTRADELACDVERVVRENAQLGLTAQIHLAEVISAPLREAVYGDGRMAESPMRVRITSRSRRV